MSAKGFTLVELLVVIGIIAILAAIVMLMINPLEITRRTRDSVRLSDLSNLQQAINIAAQEATTSGNNILCFNLATPCQEISYPKSSYTSKTDGYGWVKVVLSGQKSVTASTLPVDPLNNAEYNYIYASDGRLWEINTKLESERERGRMKTDGGDNQDYFEIGTDLNLLN